MFPRRKKPPAFPLKHPLVLLLLLAVGLTSVSGAFYLAGPAGKLFEGGGEVPVFQRVKVFVDVQAELAGGKAVIKSVQYSCAPLQNTLLQSFEAALQSFGAPAFQPFYTTASLGTAQATLRWSTLVADRVTEGTAAFSLQNPNSYKGVGFLTFPGTCAQIAQKQFTFSAPWNQPVTVTAENTNLFSGLSPTSGTCSVLRQATTPASATYVFVTDKGYETFRDGSSFWGDPIDKKEADRVFDYYIRRLLDVPPFNDYKDSLTFLRFESSKNYQECDTLCDFTVIMADTITTCNLPPSAVKNIKLMVMHGTGRNSNGGTLGLAFINTSFSQIQIGEMVIFALIGVQRAGGQASSSELKDWRSAELFLEPSIVIHELGHLYSLPHITECYSVRLPYPPLDSPVGICFSSLQNCQSITGDECDPLTGPPHPLVTKSSVSANNGGYMYPSLNILADFVPVASYQEVGKVHARFIHQDVLQNRFGLSPAISCGNGLVDESEDVDNQAPLFDYDKERIGVGFCTDLYNPDADMSHSYPLININAVGNSQNYYSKPMLSRATPIDTEIITASKNTCRLFPVCSSAINTQVSAGGSQYGGPFFLFGNYLQKGYSYAGFIPQATQTDCTNIDYRFVPGKQFTRFDQTDPKGEFIGKSTCDFTKDFNAQAPFFPDEDKAILVAYLASTPSGKTITAGILDPAGQLKQKTVFPLPSGAGSLVALRFVEFDPRDWTHNYNPRSMPTSSFAGFTHPAALVAVFQGATYVYRFQPDFANGLVTTPIYTIPSGGTITDLVDLFHDQQARQLVVTYLVTTASGTSADQVRIPTQGQKTTVTPQPLLPSLPRHSVPFSSIGVSPDRRALTSVIDNPYPQGGFVFVQELPGTPALSRTLVPRDIPPSRTVTAKTSLTADPVGRFTFATVEPETSPTPLSLNRYTLTADGLRRDGKYPIFDLTLPPSLYHVQPSELIQNAWTREGMVSAFPIAPENTLALVDQSGISTLLPAYIPQLISAYDPFFSLAAFQRGLYKTLAGNTQWPTGTDSDTLLLTSLPSGYQQLHQVILYRESSGQMVPQTLEIGIDPTTRFSHFDVFPTGAGTSSFPQNRLSCWNTYSPLFPIYPSPYAGSPLDKNGNLLLRGDTILPGYQLPRPLTVDLYSGPFCQTCSSTKIGTLTLQEQVTFLDAEVNPMAGFPTQNHALVLASVGTQLFGYHLDFDAGTVTKTPPLPLKTSGGGYLVDDRFYTTDLSSGTSMDFYSCTLLNCQSLTKTFSIPWPAAYMRDYHDSGFLAFADSLNSKTFIYDTSDGSLHSIPRKALHISASGGAITLVYEDAQQQAVAETFKNTGGVLQSISKKTATIPLVTANNLELVKGALDIGGNLVLVIENRAIYPKPNIEVRGDAVKFTPDTCSKGMVAGSDITDLGSNEFVLVDVTGGQTLSRLYKVQ